MGLIDYLKQKWEEYRITRLFVRINKFSTKEDLEIAKKLYDVLYKHMASEKIDDEGIRSVSCVLFSCPYSGHVNHIKNILENRLTDDNDPTRFLDIKEFDDDSYVLSVGVIASDIDKAITLADTSSMSALLQVNTIDGGLDRAVASSEDDISFEDLIGMAMEELPIG